MRNVLYFFSLEHLEVIVQLLISKEEECPRRERGFPGGSAIKNPPAMLDWRHGLIPGLGTSPGGRHGNRLGILA